jgi:GntR family transcriptional repressor for pyruvate dehydrogenase complex
LPAERELSAKFKVSRNTLREALRALELSGMIELRKGTAGGAFVVPGNSGAVVNGMRDLYHLGAISPGHLTEARTWLEELVIRTACERASEADLDALEANIKAAAAAEKEGDFEKRTTLHREFHLLLAAMTRNPIIVVTMEGVMEVLRQFVQTIGRRENPYTIPSRLRLLKHLRARDADRAVAEMSRFLRKLHAQYLEMWDARPVVG